MLEQVYVECTFSIQNSLHKSHNEEEENWRLFGFSGRLALVLKYKREEFGIGNSQQTSVQLG